MDKKVIDKYLPIIQSHYPDISSENITVFQDGYDHDVLLTPTHQVFRFPRTKDHGKKDLVENAFLGTFMKTSPVSVQEMTGYTDPATATKYQMYQFIPGTQLSKEMAKTLTEQELGSIAIDMGKFLTVLHSFPLSEARSINMDELDPAMYWKYFDDLLGKIKLSAFPLLSTDEQQWVEKLTNDYISITRDNPFELKVTHSDLLGEHILVDEKTHRLSGVIDFSLRIADAANDFKYFDRYGTEFLKTLYENYLPIDEHFDERRRFYAGHVLVINLYESIERKNTRMTEIYLRQLKEYISQATT